MFFYFGCVAFALSPGGVMRGRSVAGRLSREATRLLELLDSGDAYASIDPADPDMVFARTEQRGISLGAGRFRLMLAEDLVRRDLVSTERTESGRKLFRILDAGRAFLRRRGCDPASAFQAQHQHRVPATVDMDGEPARVTIDAAESPLDWLRRRKDRNGEPLVDEACYQAGERLRRDLTTAAMLPSVTSSWDLVANAGKGGRGRDPAAATDAALAARQRVTAAFRAIGADLADLLIDVCGFLKGLEQVERDRGWPARSGKIVLTLALARLADHYGIERSARGPAQSRGIRAWRAVVLEGGGE
jgi:hypothetical protein